MKFKGILALILVVGLVFMIGSAKAAMMIDNEPGNGAIVYFQANASGLGTVFSIFNTASEDRTVHLIIKDQCSQYINDVCLELSPNGAIHYGIFADAGGAYLRCINGECQQGMAPIRDLKLDDDQNYRGYVNITEIQDCAHKDTPAYEVVKGESKPLNDLIVSAALITNDWWIGINGFMIQGLVYGDLTADGQIKDEALPGGPNGKGRIAIGRWYNGQDPDAPGSTEYVASLITIFPADREPGKCENCGEDYRMKVLNYDDYETEFSDKKEVKEVASTPLKEMLIPDWAGWIKITDIDNATSCGIDNASMCGFILVEEKGGGNADAVPLFQNKLW